MRPTGKIHAARLEASPRLQRVLAFLRIRGSQGATTREIIEHADVCAVNSIIEELRENGLRIDGAYDPRAASGVKAFRYRLAAHVAPAAVQGDLFGT